MSTEPLLVPGSTGIGTRTEDDLPVDPRAEAIVGVESKAMRSSHLRNQGTGPLDREVILVPTGDRRAVLDVEINSGLDPGHRRGAESAFVGPVAGRKAGPSLQGTEVEESVPVAVIECLAIVRDAVRVAVGAVS